MKFVKSFLALFSIFLAFICSSSLLAAKELQPPAIIPILMQESGEILTTKILISDHRVYYFSLRFNYKINDQADRSRVRLLVGGYEKDQNNKVIEPGIPTPIGLSIFRVDGEQEVEVFRKDMDPILTAWGGDSFIKQIGFTELNPGLYILHLHLLQAAPAFKGTPTTFSIGFDNFKMNFNSKQRVDNIMPDDNLLHQTL
jgi:hypothetical protein